MEEDVEFLKKFIEKRKILDNIYEDPSTFQNINEEFKKDKDFLLKAIEFNVYVFEYVDDKIKNDKEFMLQAIKRVQSSIIFASNELQNDKEFLLKAAEENPACIEFISEELRNNKEFMLQVAEKNICVLIFVGEELKNDEDILKIRNNKEKVLKDIKKNFLAILGASDELKNDEDILKIRNNKEIVLKAVKENYISLGLASHELQNDKEFVLKAIEINNLELDSPLEYASEELKNDKEFMLQAIKKKYICIKYASEELLNDEEFILKAAEESIYILSYASEELKSDKGFMLKAIEMEAHSSLNLEEYSILQYASDDLKNDRDFMLKAIEKAKVYFIYTSNKLRNDKEFMLQAIKKDIWFFEEYANDELKRDKEILLCAIKSENTFLLKGTREKMCIDYVSEELLNDEEFMLEAIKNNRFYLEFVSDELKNNKEFVLKLKQINNDFIIEDMILEFKNVYKEDFFNGYAKNGLIDLLETCSTPVLNKDEYNVKIIIRGELSKEICKELEIDEENIESNALKGNGKEILISELKYEYISLHKIKDDFNVLDSNNIEYYIASWNLHIGYTTKENLTHFDSFMRKIKQEYNIFQYVNNDKKTIIEYTAEDIEKEKNEKPLSIYMNEYIKKEKDNIIVKIKHIKKPHIMLYLSNMISTLNYNNNIEHRDFIAITPDNNAFYEIRNFLMEHDIKYIYQNKIIISDIAENNINQIETFLKGFNVKYDLRRKFDDIILNMYPKNEEVNAFVYDVLDLNKIVYYDDYSAMDIDSSGVSLWMFSISKEEKEKISEMLKKPDQARIDRLKELGAPEIIIKMQSEPMECNYGVITYIKLQNQIENILQSLKLNYSILNSDGEIIKENESPEAINAD